MKSGLFLTGTDTNVGKTYAAALLVQALRAEGIDAVGMKPICCGERSDAEALFDAAQGTVSLNAINPVWFRAPAAPYAASMIENRPVDLALIEENFLALRAAHQCLIVEGIGGWRVPITERYALSDLAADFGLPIAVVVANRLGALNHAILTVESILARGLVCAGVIFNHLSPTAEEPSTATNYSILESLLAPLGVPILFELAFQQPCLTLAGSKLLPFLRQQP
jgi:dethiobiotin synthetase